MHSADYAVARCLSVRLSVRLSVCLFVCLSVRHTPVSSVNGYTYPKIFSQSVSPTIPIFPYQTGWQYSDENPLNEDVECKGVWKNHDFRPISRFISQMMQDRAIVTMKANRELHPSFRMVPVWMILSDL